MDIATVGGLMLGAVLILVSILMGGSLAAFIDMPSVLIVGGGTLAATMVKYPLSNVLGVIGLIKKTVFATKYSYTAEIDRFNDFAKIAKREGLLALEQKTQNLKDPFITKSLQLLVDGTSPEALRAIMETDISYIKERHSIGKGVLETMGAFAPAFGMIGTLIGLVLMLQNLEDPSSIGVGMATALITTFYGVLLANLVFIPLAGKLDGYSKAEIMIKEMVMEGVLSLQAGDSPYIVTDKLRAFVAHSMRKDDETPKDKAKKPEGG